MKNTETIEQFTERMSKVEFKNQFDIGRVYQGNVRTIYDFEGQCCWLESWGYRNLGHINKPATPAQMIYVAMAEPKENWLHARLICGKERAQRIAKHYGAYGIEEETYAKEEDTWFSLKFHEFEELMKMTYDVYTGKYIALWGEEPRECDKY